MAADVLVDTSIWVDFFRNKTLPTSTQLIRLLDEDRVFITGIILTELLRGARNDQELKSIQELLHPVHEVSTTGKTWEIAGILAYKLAKKGVTIFTVDAIIAAIAIKEELMLFSTDKHFIHMALHSKLKLWSSS